MRRFEGGAAACRDLPDFVEVEAGVRNGEVGRIVASFESELLCWYEMAMLPLAESVVGAATASRVMNAQAAAANVAAIAQHAAMTRLAIVRSFIADPSSVDWKVSMFDSPPTANRKIYGARLDTQEN